MDPEVVFGIFFKEGIADDDLAFDAIDPDACFFLDSACVTDDDVFESCTAEGGAADVDAAPATGGGAAESGFKGDGGAGRADGLESAAISELSDFEIILGKAQGGSCVDFEHGGAGCIGDDEFSVDLPREGLCNPSGIAGDFACEDLVLCDAFIGEGFFDQADGIGMNLHAELSGAFEGKVADLFGQTSIKVEASFLAIFEGDIAQGEPIIGDIDQLKAGFFIGIASVTDDDVFEDGIGEDAAEVETAPASCGRDGEGGFHDDRVVCSTDGADTAVVSELSDFEITLCKAQVGSCFEGEHGGALGIGDGDGCDDFPRDILGDPCGIAGDVSSEDLVFVDALIEHGSCDMADGIGGEAHAELSGASEDQIAKFDLFFAFDVKPRLLAIFHRDIAQLEASTEYPMHPDAGFFIDIAAVTNDDVFHEAIGEGGVAEVDTAPATRSRRGERRFDHNGIIGGSSNDERTFAAELTDVEVAFFKADGDTCFDGKGRSVGDVEGFGDDVGTARFDHAAICLNHPRIKAKSIRTCANRLICTALWDVFGDLFICGVVGWAAVETCCHQANGKEDEEHRGQKGR